MTGTGLCQANRSKMSSRTMVPPPLECRYLLSWRHFTRPITPPSKPCVLGPTRHPDDGSYPAPIYPSRADRRRDRDGPAVRVIEYTHDDPGRPGVGRRHRPIAGQLDPADPPALEAPPARHERWEEGPARDEIETHPSGRAAAIRSETPAGVVREICGLMLAHHAARRVMHDAAAATHDPDRLSFIDSSRVPQCRLPESPGPGIEPWYRPLLTGPSVGSYAPRRDRRYARVIEQKMSNSKERRPENLRPLQPTKPFGAAIVLPI